MKTLKNIFAIAILSVVTFAASAQTYETANLSASATVLTALSITNNTALSFGNISATTDGAVVIDPKGTAHAYVGETKTVGKFTIAAANSTSIEINWPTTLTLSDGASHTMTLTFDVNGYATDVPASSTDLTTPADVTTSGSGAYFLFVGGSLGQLASQTAGTYTGTAAFTVEYN